MAASPSLDKSTFLMQRIRLLIPDLLTGLNICIGFICIILVIHAPRTTGASHYNYILSAWLVVIAGLLDILDGAIARWLGKTGAFGIEFDSIADFTAFAIAPSILLYVYFYQGLSIFFATIPLFYLVSAAYRLARFNTNALESSRKKIVGLGTPISAVIVVAAILLVIQLQEQGAVGEVSSSTRSAMTILMLFVTSLMISSVEFITAYEYCFRNTRRIVLLLVAILAPLVVLRFRLPALSIFAVGILYITESLGRAWVRRRRSQMRDNT